MTTTVVYAGTEDGYISSGTDTASVYSDARSGSNLNADTAAEMFVGQVFDGDFYIVYQAFIAFDTSALPDGDTISAAVLRVTSSQNASDTDFDLQARLSDWGSSLTTADWVAGGSLSGLTLLAHYATSGGFTVDTGYDFTDDALPANVSKTGATRMLLCSSRTVSGTAPSGNEYVQVRPADTTGTTSDPKLTVTHAAPASADAYLLENGTDHILLESGSGILLLEGAEPVTGTGAGTGTASTASGSGSETFTGTGAATGTAATASGSGAETFTGTGAGTGTAATGSGSGVERFTGTGAGTQAAQTASGSGVETFAASGSGTGAAPTGSGSGTETFTGTGATTQALQAAAGDGLVAIAVTGTGAGTQAAQSAYGEGIGGIVIATGGRAGIGPRRLPDLPDPDADEAYLLALGVL